jgi:uncharacterized membrane protein HdeD (DUF308 family)
MLVIELNLNFKSQITNMTKRSKDNDLKKKELWDSIVAGIFLIGLAILFYLGFFWPWIIALVGLALIIKGIMKYYSKNRS